MVANAMLRDPRLSLKAKGLLAVMLSVPDERPYRMSQVEAVSDDGRDAHRTALRELEAAGYVSRQQTRNAQGKLGETEYRVSDALLTVDGKAVDGKAVHGSNIVPDAKKALEVPPALAARPQFAEAWQEWRSYRRERRLSRTDRVLKAQLAFLAEQPNPEACIRQTITNGWNGLFELKGQFGKPQTPGEANARSLDTARQTHRVLSEGNDNDPF
ncbi:hypothetical protein [Deinococcus humi]|uniref:Helix-turn-helix domain-containing protein n=1 Tax=Deinococcus humi TaxID=662880 RepID=A0A7W8JQI7_9DEIO|nr:hypothetical protein [Deinococcus humi]MBB5361370.1 hypothetical protein [Deinococcus humi]